MPTQGITLIVLAAGLGSRYGGLKQLDGMGPGNTTLMEYNIYDAIKSGVNEVIFVIREDFYTEFQEKILNKINKNIKTKCVFQKLDDTPLPFTGARGKPWGSGHALLAARHEIHTPFIVVNADDYYGPQCFQLLCNFLKNTHDNCALAGYQLQRTLSKEGGVSRGVCLCKNGYVERIVEHTGITANGVDNHGTQLAPDTCVSMNAWAFRPSLMNALASAFQTFLSHPENHNKEFYLSESTLPALQTIGLKLHVLPTDAPWIGVTYPQDRQIAADTLTQWVRKGLYPENLWK